MRFTATKIPDVVLIEPTVHEDPRGFFFESWNQREFESAGLGDSFVQDNHSRSTRGSLRGLHYQVQSPQGKLVRVVRGEVFDVAVDMRRDSTTLGEWVGMHLSAANHKMLWIPAGFAHGFYVLSDDTEFLYKCTGLYSREDERTLRWNDPEIAIEWPLIGGRPPLLSDKDTHGTPFREADLFE